MCLPIKDLGGLFLYCFYTKTLQSMYKKINTQIFHVWLMRGMALHLFLALSGVSFGGVFLTAGQGVLQEKITLHAENMKIKDVLKEIEQQCAARFGYRHQLFNPEQKVSVDAEKIPLIEVLNAIFDNALSFEDLGGLLIIKPLDEQAHSNVPVKGKVTDENGVPLPGVNVVEKGTSNGTVTDAEGAFFMEVKDTNSILVFSFIGFASREEEAGTRANLEITLKSDIKKLDEVVVVGYGSQKRSQNIGSVSQLEGKDIGNRTVPLLSSALTGQMPGVTVIQRSGQPGVGKGTIRIRGVGSFGSSSDALIIVDNIPVNDLNDVNPNDVESISVLKDASSAAIYGARASNGVILVTTKSGKKTDKMKFNYNGYIGVQTVTALPEGVNSWEYAQALNEAVPGAYSEEQINKFKDGSDPDRYPNTNYYNEFFRKNAMQARHNISMSNGNDKTQYSFSLGYLNQEGIVFKNNYQQYNIRLNLDTDASPKFKITTRLATSYSLNKEPAPPTAFEFTDMLAIIGDLLRYEPIYPIRLSNGDWGAGHAGKGTPVSQLNSDSFFKYNEATANGNIRIDYLPIKDLKLSIIGGGYLTYSNGHRFLATQKVGRHFLGPSGSTQTSANSHYKTLQSLAEYTKQINRHEVSALAGSSIEMFYGEDLRAGRQNFPSNDLTAMNLGSADGQTSGGASGESVLNSAFGRLRYNFDNRYFIEGVVRYDGSSRFPPSKRYGVFPAVAGGWRLSEEKFIKDNVRWLSQLKLKSSFGILGNQSIGNYPWQPLLASGTGYNYSFGNTVNTGVTKRTITNSDLHWESTQTFDAGVEFGVFKNLFTGSVAYFDKKTYDILVSPDGNVSNVLGFDVGVVNSGKLKNNGWEFQLNHENSIGKLNCNIGINFSIINNKVLDAGAGNVTQPNG
ncbi:MAG: SusC/RagA family TonB-linked outer membrane protein, partial [Candidatus Nephrothrix sp. EaCA]